MTRDPEVYKNPECFRPERYLPTDGSAPESDPRQICFGFGRRSVQTVSIAVTNEMTDKHTAYVPVCPLSNISLDRTDVCCCARQTGMQLAELSLSLTVAAMLSVFDIMKPIVNGQVVEPSMETNKNVVKCVYWSIISQCTHSVPASHPMPFECDIRPRSPKAAALVTSTYEHRI